MSKKVTRLDKGQKQLNLFEDLRRMQNELQAMRPASSEGSLDVTRELWAAMRRAARSCPKTSYQLAGEISHLIGRQITKTTLDAWLAESKPAHRPPADAIPAFCRATACTEPMEILNSVAGMFGLPGPDALRAEIQKYDEAEKQARAEKRKRLMFLREIESKNGGHHG